MAYSIGIWAHDQTPLGVVFRWEADQGSGGRGYVLVDLAAGTVRPCDADGEVLGSLTLDTQTGTLTGTTAPVDRSVFMRTSAAILKGYRESGGIPPTAHVYFA